MGARRNGAGFERAAFIKAFLEAFEEMPHRGSGTCFEPRAARMLAQLARRRLCGTVEAQRFAIDLSSGAWNVAVHGAVLVGSLLVLWIAGLLAGRAWGAGARPVDFGPLGVLPWPFVAACLTVCVAVLVSRFSAAWTGWTLLSFLVPNADSTNVIVSTLPAARTEQLRLKPRAAWRERFEEIKKKGAVRLVILAAHYDSARCLSMGPRKRTPKLLRAAIKSGIGTVPTIAYVLLIAFLAAMTVLSRTGSAPAVLASPWAAAAVVVLVVLLVAAAIVEMGLSLRSANLPFCPGYNDNLSAVAAVFDLLAEALPNTGAAAPQDHIAHLNPPPLSPRSGKTALMAVFTGSEENGLRGSIVFKRRVLRAARSCFGAGRLLLVNVESVSGGDLVAANAEHTFVGFVRRGDPRFLEAAKPVLEKPRIVGGESYPIEALDRPLEACTDLTGFAWRLGAKLRAFSISSKYENDQPRDYHLPSDGPETLFADPKNVATIVAVAGALGDLLEAADGGLLDG
jgi:hypothetical protein